MHVLVIGGNRFMGPLLVWRLLARGDRVTLLNRGTLTDPFGDRVERLRGDRTRELAALVGGRRFDAVVDFAAFTGADGVDTARVFEGSAGHYVMISSGQVYLVREGCPRPAREEDYDGPVMPRPEDPRDHWDWEYGVGKRACEEALAGSALPVTRVRLPIVHGERDDKRRLESYLWRLVDGGPVLLPDGGTQPVRHVYAGEVARFAAGILGDCRTMGRAFNLAQAEIPSLAEFVSLARELLGSTAPVLAVRSERLTAAGLEPASVSPFSTRWASFVDPSRARDELGFHHEPLASYLGKIIASFLAFPAADRPRTYAQRAVELELAAGL